MNHRPFMNHCRRVVGTSALVLFVTVPAHAGPIFGSNDPPADSGGDKPEVAREKREQWRPGFGARVGGYGFARSDGSGKWDECRMNGFGVFGTLDANKYLFGELSVDFYNAAPEVRAGEGMDRVSTHVLSAVGLRMFPDFVLTPYVQLGAGGEWTRIDLGASRTERLFPMGFVGIGAELNATRELKLGANFRMLGTMQPDESGVTTSSNGGVALTRQALTSGDNQDVPTKFGLAAQGQFFVRYAL